MRRLRLTERRIAIICAIVLVTLSVTAAFRQHDWWQHDTAQPATEQTADMPSIDGGIDSTSKTPADATTPTPTTDNTPTTVDSNTDSPAPAVQDTIPQIPPATTDGKQQVYSYTAQAGDSYTELARQAVERYVQAHDTTLTPDQLLDAEVAITNEAGSPQLEIGQTIQIAETTVSQAIQATGTAASTPAPTANTPAPTKTTADYTYTADVGDSYTQHARSAIASYCQQHTLTLSTAQRVAAETYLAVSAGSPQLEIGQTVSLSHTSVQTAVERASQLDTNAQTAWQPYADTVAW